MTTFVYEARDPAGRERSGRVEAADAGAAVASLRTRGLLVFDVAADAPHHADASRTRDAAPPRGGWRASGVALEVSLRQLGVMLRSGLTLLAGIRTVAAESASRKVRAIWLDAAEEIQSGSSLMEAMGRHRAFGRLATRLVEVGEQTGELDTVLIRASEALERRRLLRMRLVNALLYPAVVLVAAIAATAFMLTYAVPRIAVYLQSSGNRLPAMTSSLVDLSLFLRSNWPALLVGLLAASLAAWLFYSTRSGRLFADRAVLRLPLVGLVLRIGVTAGLAHALEIMLRSGVTIVESLRTLEGLHQNRHVQRALARARAAVTQGDPLAPALASDAFMPMLSSMVAVGEQSGTLDEVLAETAAFHEHRLSSLIDLLATAVEVAVVLVVGTIVGYVYIAFMLALYQAATP